MTSQVPVLVELLTFTEEEQKVQEILWPEVLPPMCAVWSGSEPLSLSLAQGRDEGGPRIQGSSFTQGGSLVDWLLSADIKTESQGK